mgnify:CR=1 FL=1
MNNMFVYKDMAVSLDGLKLVYKRDDQYFLSYGGDVEMVVGTMFGLELLEYLKAKQNE